MDCTNYTTEIRKGQHLTFEGRVIIQTRLQDGCNINQIAKELNRSYNCIKTEVDRGMTPLYNDTMKNSPEQREDNAPVCGRTHRCAPT